jgi:ribose transport system permease protein
MSTSNDRIPDPSRGASKVSGDRVSFLSTELGKAAVLITLALLMILASRLISPSLGGLSQISAVLVLSSFLIVVAFGQQMVVLNGGLDLSIPSLITVGGLLAFAWAPHGATELLLVAIAVMAITGAIGMISGLGVTLLAIPPFIMTLSMGIIIYSACLGATRGTPRGQGSETIEALFSGNFLGVAPIIPLIALLTALAIILQSRTTFGRFLYATGSNRQAAYIAGLPVRRMTVATYACSSASAGLCGMLLVGFSGGATLTMGQSYLLPSIAAVVVGGTAITGGRGSFITVVAAALLITTFTTVISSVQIEEGWRTILYGAIVLIAILAMRDGNAPVMRQRLLPFLRGHKKEQST